MSIRNHSRRWFNLFRESSRLFHHATVILCGAQGCLCASEVQNFPPSIKYTATGFPIGAFRDLFSVGRDWLNIFYFFLCCFLLFFFSIFFQTFFLRFCILFFFLRFCIQFFLPINVYASALCKYTPYRCKCSDVMSSIDLPEEVTVLNIFYHYK